MPELEELEGLEASIYAAKELQQFLKHRAVEEAFERTEARITAAWKRGQSPLEREMAWHKLQAFQELKSELRGFADRRPALDKT